MNKFRKFVLNGLIITAVSLFMRTVSVSFNIYLSNKIGAIAMGVFTLISTVYGFAITVATSGIGLASTRHIAEAIGESSKKGGLPSKDPYVRCIVKKCATYALSFSIGSAIVLFFSAPFIGSHILMDARTVRPLQALAFSLPAISLSSVLSGYFIAVRRVYKNAIVTVFGQLIRIFGSIWLVALLGASDVESACMAIVLGGTLSEILSFFIQYLLYAFERNTERKKAVGHTASKSIWNKILHTALPVAFSAYVRSGLITIEHILIPWGLERSGSSKDSSLAAYGTVHSMVFPLVLFPSALSGSFAGLLVPEIAESEAVGDRQRISRIIDRVFHSVLIYSIGVAGIIICFSNELSSCIYPNTDAGKFILIISPLIPIMYIDTSVDSILKGLGEQVYCMGVNIVDSFLSVILVWILLPRMGITGYIITVYFTEIINAAFSISRLWRVASVKPKIKKWLIKPIFAIVLSTAAVRVFLSAFVGEINSSFMLSVNILLTFSIYMLSLIAMGSIKIKASKRSLN